MLTLQQCLFLFPPKQENLAKHVFLSCWEPTLQGSRSKVQLALAKVKLPPPLRHRQRADLYFSKDNAASSMQRKTF
jgi:hypothetical protein